MKTEIRFDSRNLNSPKMLRRRLENYYFYRALKQDDALFKKQLERFEKYFKVVQFSEKGIPQRAISRKVGIPRGTVQHWLAGQMPFLVNIAVSLPSKCPKKGYSWLHLNMKPRGKPYNFIEVPNRIASFGDVICLMNQISPLKGENMVRWRNEFGDITKEGAFACLLGIILSDADKSQVSNFSRICRIRLSSKYDWSFNLGEAMCYCLGKIGFRAWRHKDSMPFKNHPNRFYNWTS